MHTSKSQQQDCDFHKAMQERCERCESRAREMEMILRRLFDIDDTRAFCPWCKHITLTTYGGLCHKCHVIQFTQLGRPHCPELKHEKHEQKAA